MIYSMASSSAIDAPRGMGFLFSRNRMNVATSRARCQAVLVGSPALFMPHCDTPEQIRLANGFCRFMELAETIAQRTPPSQNGDAVRWAWKKALPGPMAVHMENLSMRAIAGRRLRRDARPQATSARERGTGERRATGGGHHLPDRGRAADAQRPSLWTTLDLRLVVRGLVFMAGFVSASSTDIHDSLCAIACLVSPRRMAHPAMLRVVPRYVMKCPVFPASGGGSLTCSAISTG